MYKTIYARRRISARTAAFSLGTQATTFQVTSVTGSAIVHNTGQEAQVTQSVPASNAPSYTTCDTVDPDETCQVISASARHRHKDRHVDVLWGDDIRIEIMFVQAFQRFILCAAYLAAGCASSAQGLTSAPVREFVRTGPTAEVVRDLVRSARFEGVYGGVVGLEHLDDSRRPVSVAAVKTDMGSVLRTICQQDSAYRIVETDSPDVVNILAADSRAPGHDVLEFRIPTLDIEFDDSADRLIGGLPDYSPVLWHHLQEVYLRGGGIDMRQPGAIGGFNAIGRHPHYSVHLTNASVREVLNAIVLQSFRMSQAIGVDPRLVSTPDQLRVTPVGWEYRFLDPRGMPFYVWVHQLFSAL
jgi:hypothetical protein